MPQNPNVDRQEQFLNLRKVTIYLLTSCNTEQRIAQNIYIHNSNRNYKKLTTITILIKKRIGIDCKNYKKQCPGLDFRLMIALGTIFILKKGACIMIFTIEFC